MKVITKVNDGSNRRKPKEKSAVEILNKMIDILTKSEKNGKNN